MSLSVFSVVTGFIGLLAAALMVRMTHKAAFPDLRTRNVANAWLNLFIAGVLVLAAVVTSSMS